MQQTPKFMFRNLGLQNSVFPLLTVVPHYFSPTLFSLKGEKENVSNSKSNFQRASRILLFYN